MLVGGFFVEGFGDSPALVFLAYSGGAAPVGEDAGQGGFFEFVGSVVERIDGDAIVGGFNEFLPDVQGALYQACCFSIKVFGASVTSGSHSPFEVVSAKGERCDVSNSLGFRETTR